ncbi:uncharacterized protein LOC142348545 [Convolutriloba macropyga]|uniref:uncharacterized protein LOC142348545 n=1 Tax=Convolutriloba macropyga TaxID=536237 RepID=UPI003F51DEFC
MDENRIYSASEIDWLTRHDDSTLQQLRVSHTLFISQLRQRNGQLQKPGDMMMFINGESEEESEHEWIRRAGEVLDKVTTYNLTDLLHFLVPKQLQASGVPEPLLAAFLSAFLFMALLAIVLLLLTLCFYFTYYHKRQLAKESEL